jgi:hypothetical protein
MSNIQIRMAERIVFDSTIAWMPNCNSGKSPLASYHRIGSRNTIGLRHPSVLTGTTASL